MLPDIKRVRVVVRDVTSIYLSSKTIKPHIRIAPVRSNSQELPVVTCSPVLIRQAKLMPKKLSFPQIQKVQVKEWDSASPLLPWAPGQ